MGKLVHNVRRAVFLAGLSLLSASIFGMENQNKEWFNAAKTGNLAEIRRMVKNGFDINVRDKLDDTVLTIAARAGNSKIVEYLLETKYRAGLRLVNTRKVRQPWDDKQLSNFKNRLGLNVEARNCWGGTALMVAVLGGSPRTVELLIDVGADVNVSDIFGRTPLSFALEKKRDVRREAREKGLIALLDAYLQGLKEGKGIKALVITNG